MRRRSPARSSGGGVSSSGSGGVGVIVLTTAILARPGSGSLTLYESEARSEKIHPSIVSTVRTIWWIFILFTFSQSCCSGSWGMPPLGTINHGSLSSSRSLNLAALARGGCPLWGRLITE
nr:potassium transporter TrkG [Haloferax sp. ATB1]